MEEVVRFLERCHHSLDVMTLAEPIPRSKSTYHVAGDPEMAPTQTNGDDKRSNASASPPPPPPPLKGLFHSRVRCSTIDAPKLMFHRQLAQSNIQAAGSYSNFRDFTW